MLTANLLAIVADLLAELELDARDVAELVVLPDAVAALHLPAVDHVGPPALESTSCEHTLELRRLAVALCQELDVEPTAVASVRLSAVDGVVAELAWPAPIRLALP